MQKVSYGPLMRHIIYLSFFALLAALQPSADFLTTEVLKQQFSHLKNLRQLSANFEQTRNVKDWGVQIKTTGYFKVEKTPKKKVIWNILSPSYTALKMEDDKLFINTSKAKENWKDLRNPKVVQQMQNVFAWLAMDAETISKDFQVKKTSLNSFSLYPKVKGAIFKKIAIQMDAKKQVENITMTEANDDSIHIQFSNTKILK